MDLRHEFTVAAPVDRTWAALEDIEGVAGCFPGAQVTSVDDDGFAGSCKVKLGPIALVYNGSGKFVAKDEAAGTMRLEARGKDKRGNGTAGADVSVTLADDGAGGTAVEVVTDLNVTGKPAQFGRGVMQDVSDKLLAQFVVCLQDKVADSESARDAAAAPETPPDPSAPAEDSPPPRSVPPPAAGDDALDLGAAVLPVLVRSYGTRLAVGLGILALVVLWRRRRRRR